MEITSTGEEQVWTDDMTIEQVEATIVEEYHYDPFGMNLVGIEKAGDNRYQYNEQSEKQLDAQGNGYFYETPLRQYDPQLGRFGGVDLLAEEYATMSPYQYAANNPILFSDPTGARPAPCYCDGYMRGAGEMFDKNSGRIRINTIGGTYTTSSGNTYGSGSGYSYGGGYTANDRMDAMYSEAKAEQALQTLAQGWGGSYSNGSITISGTTHFPSMPQFGTYEWSYSIPVYVDRNQQSIGIEEASLLDEGLFRYGLYSYMAGVAATAAELRAAYKLGPALEKTRAARQIQHYKDLRAFGSMAAKRLWVLGLVSGAINYSANPTTENAVTLGTDAVVSTVATFATPIAAGLATLAAGAGITISAPAIAAGIAIGATAYFTYRIGNDIYNYYNK